ncbi:hypothetical protein RJ640_018677 [Escallonia rubra]|uniref:MAR-binding filament-like protein 1 n=1 Tax=Escallonia rubra TaxID=112253 RepID=A0AA88QR89_9ASTE|nr:hypothetical protein RJ640_018677 [Escallonia rubra]
MLVTAVVALANGVGYWGVGLVEEKGMGGDGNYVDCSGLYLFHIDFCLLQKTVLSNLIQEIEPLDVSVIQKDVPPATVDAMKRTISGMLGLLPSDQFQVSIEALWEPLSKLLISSMMTGYTLRNAECRLCLERNLDTDEGFVSRRKTEDSQLEAEGMLDNDRMNKTSGHDESLESETSDSKNGVPGLGQIPPEAEKYILNLQSRLSSAKKELLEVKRKSTALQMQQFVGEEQNDLLDYLRSLQPEKVAELSEPTSPELKETIHSVVHGLLATLSPKMHSKAPTLSESTSTGIVNLGVEEDCIDLVENTSLPFHPLISLTRDYLARLLFWCMLLGHHLRGLEYRSELMELLALTSDVENDASGGEQKTVLSNLIQEIEPLDVSVIQKDVPPATVDAMKRTISGMLGLLPSDQFQVSIEALWEPLSKLLISSMMTGYTLRNAECRLCLERNLDTDEGFVSRRKTEDSQLEAEGMLDNDRMNKTSGHDESLESETSDSKNGVPGLGQIPPEAEKYILNLQSRLSSAKKELLEVKRKSTALQMQQFVGEEQNDLLDYLRSLQPEKVAELSEPTSPELKETIHSVVHGLLATLSPKMHSKAPTLSESTSTGIANLGVEEDCIDLVENTSLPFHPLISLTRDYLARLLFWCMLLGHHLRGLEYRSELMELLALTSDVENDASGGEQVA